MRSVLSKELLVCHRLVIELIMVVLRVVKELTVSRIELRVVL